MRLETLTPRVNDKDVDPEAINRLFFASISLHFKGDRPRYSEVLSTLTADPHELVKDLADQIHANAKIATVKAKYAKWAIRSALAAGTAVAVLATIIGITNLRGTRGRQLQAIRLSEEFRTHQRDPEPARGNLRGGRWVARS